MTFELPRRCDQPVVPSHRESRKNVALSLHPEDGSGGPPYLRARGACKRRQKREVASARPVMDFFFCCANRYEQQASVILKSDAQTALGPGSLQRTKSGKGSIDDPDSILNAFGSVDSRESIAAKQRNVSPLLPGSQGTSNRSSRRASINAGRGAAPINRQTRRASGATLQNASDC